MGGGVPTGDAARARGHALRAWKERNDVPVKEEHSPPSSGSGAMDTGEEHTFHRGRSLSLHYPATLENVHFPF